jgi:hypothetical protein
MGSLHHSNLLILTAHVAFLVSFMIALLGAKPAVATGLGVQYSEAAPFICENESGGMFRSQRIFSAKRGRGVGSPFSSSHRNITR